MLRSCHYLQDAAQDAGGGWGRGGRVVVGGKRSLGMQGKERCRARWVSIFVVVFILWVVDVFVFVVV